MKRRAFLRLTSGSIIAAGYTKDTYAHQTSPVVDNSTRMLKHFSSQITHKQKYRPSGFTTGFDNISLTLEPGQLTVVASRPSVGRSAFIQNIARHLSTHYQAPVGFISHMRKQRLTERMTVSEQFTTRSETSQRDLPRPPSPMPRRLAPRMPGIIIDDAPQITMPEFNSSVERMILEHDVQALMIDGFENFYVPNHASCATAAIIYPHLKHFAQQARIPVIITARLNRNLEDREDKRPRLTDLDDYRIIDRHTDAILYLYRDEVYFEDSEYKGLAEVKIDYSDGRYAANTLLAVYPKYATFSDNYPAL